VTYNYNNMKKRTILLQVVLALAPLVYLAVIWNGLPARVPLHFNAQMVANSYGSKESLGVVAFFMAVLAIGTSLLVLNVDKIDPKQRNKPLSKVMVTVSWVVVAVMTSVGILVVYTSANYVEGHKNHLSKLFFPLICLAFVVLGNYMNNVKPNFFFGIRTPWTLSDDDNWRKTHHLGSRLWFFGGLIMLALTLALPEVSASFVILVGGLILAIIPIVYSYRLFRNKQRSQP
jgi:uncharacterized membrane protein